MDEVEQATAALLNLSRTLIKAATPKQIADLYGAVRLVMEEIDEINRKGK